MKNEHTTVLFFYFQKFICMKIKHKRSYAMRTIEMIGCAPSTAPHIRKIKNKKLAKMMCGPVTKKIMHFNVQTLPKIHLSFISPCLNKNGVNYFDSRQA